MGSGSRRNILVTGALPYANGAIHLGHLMEVIQTDIWVRFQRMRGHHCIYLCADDAHGTAIMLSADAQGLSPEALIKQVKAEHERDFADFLISFDNYHSTHSDENRWLTEAMYGRLEAAGHIERREISQLYDPEKQLFLADRYIVGGCPRCKAPGQYGDNCEECGSTYNPAELIAPKSKISGATPVEKQSMHHFFDLPAFTGMLRGWTRSGTLQAQVANKLAEWLDAGLQQWDISRDAPYFGFEIPGAPGKYFYVWVDAPVGYMASHLNYLGKAGEAADESHETAYWDKFLPYWAADGRTPAGEPTELYHFIGKDIINFHTLLWPAMLKSAGCRLPTAVFAHGFLTVDGTKMSKSRGTFINARTYLDHLQPEYLRYYLAGKLSSGIDDLDLNLEDFVQRVNTDLVGKVVNIASRCAGFIERGFNGQLARTTEAALLAGIRDEQDTIAAHYEGREYAKAMRQIMAMADKVNQYINDQAPWVTAKANPTAAEVQQVCSTGLNAFRLLMCYLKPVLPAMAKSTEAFLNIPPLQWSDAGHLLDKGDHSINPFQPLLQRIKPEQVQAMVSATRETDSDKE